jgi:hypothetical protein
MGCNEAGLARFYEMESPSSQLAEPYRYPTEYIQAVIDSCASVFFY